MPSSSILTMESAMPKVTVPEQNQPPIVYFFQLILHVTTGAFSVFLLVARSFVILLRRLLVPVLSVSSPILYLLSPVIVLVNIFIDAFLLTPYRFISYLLYNLYPVYVLIGTALICAAVVGLGARLVIYAASELLRRPNHSGTRIEQQEKSSLRNASGKRVSIKSES